LTAVLRAFALVGPPKTRFSLVVSLGEVGLITHQVPNEVSALSTFDFPFIQTLPGAMQYLSSPDGRYEVEKRIGDAPLSGTKECVGLRADTFPHLASGKLAQRNLGPCCNRHDQK
jgi:hypothetical protein